MVDQPVECGPEVVFEATVNNANILHLCCQLEGSAGGGGAAKSVRSEMREATRVFKPHIGRLQRCNDYSVLSFCLSLSPSSLTSSPPPSLHPPSLPPPSLPLPSLSTVDRLRYQSITALPEFSTKSFDELRFAHISQQPEGGLTVGKGSSIAERGLIHRRMATLKKLLTCRQIRPFIIKLVRTSGEVNSMYTLSLNFVPLYPNSSTARMEMATPPSWRPSASITTLLHCKYSSLWKSTTKKSWPLTLKLQVSSLCPPNLLEAGNRC